MTADFLSDPAVAAARGVSSPAAAEGDAAHNAALMPGPAHPVPWRALLGDVLLEADDWSALASMARVRRCRAGDLALRRGDAAVAMVALCEGRVVAGGPLAGPCWLDLHTAWLDGRYEEDARIVSATALVMEWPMAAATLWLRSQPPVLAALLRVVVEALWLGVWGLARAYAGPARRALEAAARAGYYLGVPVWLVLRLTWD